MLSSCIFKIKSESLDQERIEAIGNKTDFTKRGKIAIYEKLVAAEVLSNFYIKNMLEQSGLVWMVGSSIRYRADPEAWWPAWDKGSCNRHAA